MTLSKEDNCISVITLRKGLAFKNATQYNHVLVSHKILQSVSIDRSFGIVEDFFGIFDKLNAIVWGK